MTRHGTTPSEAQGSPLGSPVSARRDRGTGTLPIFFRASVYALAAAFLGAVGGMDPLVVFCLVAVGYLGCVAFDADLVELTA